MIDYEKLKVIHELMLKENKYYITMEFGWSDKFAFNLYDDQTEDCIFCTANIDKLLEKLQSLVTPEPKYKLDQRVWINWLEEPREYRITARDEMTCLDGEISLIYYLDSIGHMPESNLFPTRQALIEHQIEYWQSLQDKCQHDWSERIDRGEPFKDPYRWFVRCKKCYAEQYVCNILNCQHESDMNRFSRDNASLKCIKCGEFYR